GLLACVSGEPGSGKTTLAQEFRQRCGEEAECARIQATLFMNNTQFLDNLAAELPWLDAGQDWLRCLDTIARRAADLDLEARALVIIIDDAHELGSEVVAVLAQILKRCEGGLSLLLLGEAQLPNLLRQSLPAAMRARVAWFELAPLSSEDSFDYVRFKLATAGYTQALPLSGGQLRALYDQARGNPARLNALIAAALMESEATVASAVSVPARPSLFSQGQPYWLAAGVLVVLLVGVLLFVDDGGAGSMPATRSIPVAVNADGQVERDTTPAQAPVPAETSLVQDEPGAMPEADPVPDAPQAQSPATAEAVAPADADARPGSPASPQPASTPVVASLPDFTRSLLDAAPEGFTIQVMGTRSQDNARRFLDTHFSAADSGVIETRFENRPWYVVVHGNFTDRADASAVIAGLPEPVRVLQPFVRSLEDIQAAVRQQLSSR
ncbi:MAG: AAA family ATPase, partial [Pseudohongiellaceae bacterium]